MQLKRHITAILIFMIFFFPAVTVSGADREDPYMPRLVKIEKESEVDSLGKEGVEILRRRGDLLLCLFPNSAATRGNHPAPRRPRPIAPALDAAKNHYDAFTVQDGTAVGIPFTGKGVVVGICDIGIDPLHPTFLDADGRSRIKRLVHYIEGKGIRLEIEGDDEYRRWVTDNPDERHATHVCGILAGGGAGTPYSGVASDAEIVATVSTLTEVGLLAGVEDIIDYAKEVGKPAVINMSVGCCTGPHDGSSLFSQYLDMCADDAIIVLSAGNEGTHANTLTHRFTPQHPTVEFRLGSRSWTQFNMYGLTEIWSGSEVPLTVSLGLYDADRKEVVGWQEPVTLTGGDFRRLEWNGTGGAPDDFPFTGEMLMIGDVYSENGRHLTALEYEFESPEPVENGGWAKYELAVRVTGRPGDDVEVYADGTYTRLASVTGNTVPSSERSVSDLACGFKVISVGMYGNRDSVPLSAPTIFMDDDIYYHSTGYQTGATVPASSYGTLRDGRCLPLTTAPGATLVSAASRPWLSRYPNHPHLRMGATEWVEQGGTSMSAPYVAGYIATWLEAAPELNSEDVVRIISECNRKDIPNINDPRNANGYFNPVKGLRLAMKSDGVVSVDNPALLLAPGDHVEVCDMTGVKIYAGAASGLSGIGKGIYMVKTPRGVMKMALR